MTSSEFTQAELFDIFSNSRRRRTVQFLKRQNGSCDLAPLVEQVAAWENDTEPENVTRAQRRRVYISLYQTHLPMLEDHGIVDWDPEAHAIELLPDADLFDPYLSRHVGDQRPWYAYYGALTGTSVVLLALSWLSLGPLSVGVMPFVALGLCLAVLAVSLAQRHSRHPEMARFARHL